MHMVGYENVAGFWPGPDMISGATLITSSINSSSMIIVPVHNAGKYKFMSIITMIILSS